jgi:hypothetical protein
MPPSKAGFSIIAGGCHAGSYHYHRDYIRHGAGHYHQLQLQSFGAVGNFPWDSLVGLRDLPRSFPLRMPGANRHDQPRRTEDKDRGLLSFTPDAGFRFRSRDTHFLIKNAVKIFLTSMTAFSMLPPRKSLKG